MKKELIKSKVIEAYVLFTVPENKLMRMVFTSDSIDSVILDLQEEYPESNITRNSILSWKFMTIGDIKKDRDLITELNNSGMKLFAGRKQIKLLNENQCSFSTILEKK